MLDDKLYCTLIEPKWLNLDIAYSVFALIYVHFKCQLSSTSQFYIKYLLRDKAAGYYQQGNDLLKFAECLYQLEDYKGIERIIEELPDCHDTLYDFGLRFANLGMIKQAMYAFIKVCLIILFLII